MSATFGRTSRVPLASYVPDESSLRTWLVMSLWGWTPFSGTLPRWGMTRSGELYELPTPALPTTEPESSSLLPTPAVNDMGAGKTVEAWDEWTERMRAKHGNGNGHGPSLTIEAQRLMPTPTTEPQTGNGHARNLGAEARLLGTPTSRIHKGGSSAQRERGADKARLEDQVMLLPTPTSSDANGAGAHGTGSTDLRTTILSQPSIGAPTSEVSAAGKPSRSAQLLDLLSPDEVESA